MYIYLIAGLAFVSVFLISFLIIYFIISRNDPVKQRLHGLAAGNEDGNLYTKRRISLIKKTLGFFRSDTAESSDTRRWLAQAGYYNPQAVYDYYGIRVGGAILMGALAAVLSLHFRIELHQLLLITATALLVGSYVPKLRVGGKIRRRAEEIRRAVPNMLDLMVVCVEAGLSLTASIQKLANETKISCVPLSNELHILTREILIGKAKGEAFRNLADRTGVEELRSLAVTLIQTDKLGTSVAKSLKVLADSMRFKRRQRAEEQANKASVKLVFPLVFLIFPELLVVLVGPALITLTKVLGDVAP